MPTIDEIEKMVDTHDLKPDGSITRKHPMKKLPEEIKVDDDGHKVPPIPTCMCMDCGKVLPVNEQSKHECKGEMTDEEIAKEAAKVSMEMFGKRNSFYEWGYLAGRRKGMEEIERRNQVIAAYQKLTTCYRVGRLNLPDWVLTTINKWNNQENK